MVHAGRAPNKGVKYGVNCFTNEKPMREIHCPTGLVERETAVVQRVSDLAEPGKPTHGDDGRPLLRLYEVILDPKVIAVPGFLDPAEVEHILEYANGVTIQPKGPFKEGTQAIAHLPFEATPMVQGIEVRMVAMTGEPLDNLAKLRIVRPGLQDGLCNRGCGKHVVYVCLGKEEEVFFPRLGIRFLLTAGDALSWTNVNWDTGLAREEMRTLRLHRSENSPESLIGIDGYFHDNPLRAQQKVRSFVADSDLKTEVKTDVKAGVVTSGGYAK